MAAEKPKTGERFNPHKRLTQIMVPLSMAQSGKFSAMALIVYGRLQFYKSNNCDSCFVFRRTLAGELKTSVAKIDRAIAELRANKVLDVIERRGKSENEYVFIYSDLFESDLPKDSAPVRSQDIHRQEVYLEGSGKVDSTPVQSQPYPDSAYLQSQGRVDSAKTAPLTLQNSGLDSAKLPSHIRCKRSLKEVLKEVSSSSSSAETVKDDEDDSHSSNNGTGADTHPVVVVVGTVQHSPEDVQEFGERMQQSISFGFPGHSLAPTESLVRQVLACAPDWSAAEIWEGLKINNAESPSKIQGHRWFLKVVRDIYERRNGIPPELPAPNQWNAADQWKHDFEEQQEQQRRSTAKCSYCLDTGYWPEGQVCRYRCEAAEEKRRYFIQSNRWDAIYARYRAEGRSAELDEKVGVIFCGVASEAEREAILSQLDEEVPLDEILVTTEQIDALING